MCEKSTQTEGRNRRCRCKDTDVEGKRGLLKLREGMNTVKQEKGNGVEGLLEWEASKRGGSECYYKWVACKPQHDPDVTPESARDCPAAALR